MENFQVKMLVVVRTSSRISSLLWLSSTTGSSRSWSSWRTPAPASRCESVGGARVHAHNQKVLSSRLPPFLCESNLLSPCWLGSPQVLPRLSCGLSSMWPCDGPHSCGSLMWTLSSVSSQTGTLEFWTKNHPTFGQMFSVMLETRPHSTV